jgi:integrase
VFERDDGRWCGVISLGWRSGKRKRKYVYGETAAAVRDLMTKAKSNQLDGLPIAPDRQTVGDFLAGWLERSVRPSVRPLTWQQYEAHVRLYLASRSPSRPDQPMALPAYAPLPALGNIELSKLRPEHVQNFTNSKLKTNLSPRTVQLSLVILRRALDSAVKWGLIARNVAKLVDGPKVRHREIVPLDPEQAGKFLEAAQGCRFEAIYRTALALGLREGEALGLRWRDVDFEKNTLTVSQTLQRIGGKRYGEKSKLQFSEPKTDRSRRTVAMPEAVIRPLKIHRARQSQDRLAAGSRWVDFDLVFTTRKGTPLGARDVVLDFKAVLKDAKLPSTIRFHDLRHSAASLLLAQGVQMRVVMELLGHSTIKLTADTYSHVFPEVMRDAAKAMDKALNSM